VIGVPAMLASVWLLCALIWRFGVREDDATSRRFAVIIRDLTRHPASTDDLSF